MMKVNICKLTKYKHQTGPESYFTNTEKIRMLKRLLILYKYIINIHEKIASIYCR